MEKPEEPGLSECCGGGSCCPCVWDVYFDQLAQWQQQQIELNQADVSGAEPDQNK